MPDRSFAAILLAAGMSRRMGRLKMLLPFGDRPMLARVTESLLASKSIASITLVCGHAEQEIRAAIGEYRSVHCVTNPAYAEKGMFSSVKTGVGALPTACDAFFLVLGDQPMVLPETLEALAASWHPETAPIVIPTFDGKRGHPVLIAARLSAEILALEESATLKTLMLRHADLSAEIEVQDSATVHDVDTPEDYEIALQRWRENGREYGRGMQ